MNRTQAVLATTNLRGNRGARRRVMNRLMGGAGSRAAGGGH